MKASLGILLLLSLPALAQNRPGPNRPDDNRPGNNRPDNNRPDDNRPGNNRPGPNRPDDDRPGNNRPDNNRPTPGPSRPDDNRPGPGRPSDVRPGDACPRPGMTLSTQSLGDSGEQVSANLRRSGNNDIPTGANFSGVIKARTFKNFRDSVCAVENYTVTERVCDSISPDLALGRGNQFLMDLYNLQIGTMKRAELFARNIRFSDGMLPAERLDLSMKMVGNLNQLAARSGIPRSWEDFSADLNSLIEKGIVPPSVVDEILRFNEERNRSALGYLPFPGADIRQGNGNGRLNKIFDLGLSPEVRIQRLMDTVGGVNSSNARKLSRSFVAFASMNGIPSSWDQFVLMVKDARNQGDIDNIDFQRIVGELEMENRRSLGFEITAEVCRVENAVRSRNVVRVEDRQVLMGTSVKNYEVSLENAPLVAGEEESIILRYDGLSPIRVESMSSFNAHQVRDQRDMGPTVKIQVIGNRKAVKPRNTLKVRAIRNGETNIVQIQNTGFNPKIGGRVIVKVRYINDKFLGNDTKGTETYELTDGNLQSFTAALKNKSVDLVKVSMQIVGSPLFGSEFSDEIKEKN